MRRLTPILLVALMAVATPSEAATWLRSLEQAQSEARKSGGFILVDMFAEWCGWCHRLEKEVFTTPAFRDATRDMVLLRLDTEDRAEGTRMMRELGVTTLPTIVILTPDLQIAGMIRGYAPAERYIQQILDERRKYADFMREALNEKALENDPQKNLDVAVELLQRRHVDEGEKRLARIFESKNVPAVIRARAGYEIASLLSQKGSHDEAIAALKRVVATGAKGEIVERAELLIGESYLRKGDYKAALEHYRAFRKAHPASAFAAQADYIIPQLEAALTEAN